MQLIKPIRARISRLSVNLSPTMSIGAEPVLRTSQALLTAFSTYSRSIAKCRMPTKYSPPEGRAFLTDPARARFPAAAHSQHIDPKVCEMKRLFVLPGDSAVAKGQAESFGGHSTGKSRWLRTHRLDTLRLLPPSRSHFTGRWVFRSGSHTSTIRGTCSPMCCSWNCDCETRRSAELAPIRQTYPSRGNPLGTIRPAVTVRDQFGQFILLLRLN